MQKKLRALFLADPELRHPWQDDVVEAVGFRHELHIFDPALPLALQFKGIDVVIDFGGSIGTREMADAASSVRLWQILGTGYDHFNLDYWRKKNIPVANCPGTFTGIPLAECATMFILMLARSWHGTQSTIKQRLMCVPMGQELENLRLGLVGFGASAQQLALRGRAFGMKISTIDVRDISPEERQKFGLEFAGKSADLDRLVSESDFLSLHLHLNQETRHLIDERRLGLMKSTAYLINVARGGLVDEKALHEALTDGRLAGAAFDAFDIEPVDPDHPLLQLPNFIGTPHIAGVTDCTSRRRALCAAENVDRIAAGLEPLYRIDTLASRSQQ
jgi:phosphoglycerate dehydrogenase-like enzyme